MDMKIFLLCLMSLLSIVFGRQASAQEMATRLPSDNILFTANGYNYTEEHFNRELRFVEFIVGTPISDAEKQLGLQATEQNFSQNPSGVIQDLNNIDTQMQQMYRITDIAQIGRMRSALIYQIFSGTQHLQEKPFIVQLMMKYVPLLAFDAQNMLAFTAGDCQAYIQLMQLNAQMAGQNAQLTSQQINEIQQSLVQQFPTLTLEQKTSLCGMQVLYQYLSKAYAQMTPEQKQQMQSQMMQQQMPQQQVANDMQWPQGVQTTAEKQAALQQMRQNMNANNAAMGMYYDSMMGNHATMLNTIENFGDTGVYWEYK